MRLEDLPTLNASLNGLASFFLLAGFLSIRARKIDMHQIFMGSAVVSSALFLTSYLIYHFNAEVITRYTGSAPWLYYPILISHIPLAALMVPFIFMALWRAYQKDFVAHARITRKLWPVWMYVSVTGVVIYLMLWVAPFNG